MNTSGKIKLLLVACLSIVGLLIYIQYQLISNTYRLTKVEYEKEVKAVANTIISKEPGIEKQLLSRITAVFSKKAVPVTIRQQLFNIIIDQSNSTVFGLERQYNDSFRRMNALKDVSYSSSYDLFTIEINGNSFSLVQLVNQADRSQNRLTDGDCLLQVRNFQGIIDEKNLQLNPNLKDFHNLKVKFQGKQFINIAKGQGEIMKRMTSTFLLAAGLLLAEIVLFYAMFSAILKQKRLTDIQKDFANNITHELKTPLSSVKVMFKSLERKEVLENQVHLGQLLQSLKRQYEKIQAITDSVLESAMVTEFQPELCRCDISQHLREYASDLRLEKHLLEAIIEPISQELRTNLAVLDKALNNLIDNAIKYSPESLKITFKAYAQHDFYIIKIIDLGPGIPITEQHSVFDKFYRVPERNKHTVKGLGLGLYISKQAVQQLGGSLTLFSKEGGGCTFTIKLPINEN
ncbi:sensor histidine kinase [Mucilaginibacter frigoritolerans]|nr:HAMP domain-containing sensor histidine kinase [Mucilaginibacter frigoritolerans]